GKEQEKTLQQVVFEVTVQQVADTNGDELVPQVHGSGLLELRHQCRKQGRFAEQVWFNHFGKAPEAQSEVDEALGVMFVQALQLAHRAVQFGPKKEMLA